MFAALLIAFAAGAHPLHTTHTDLLEDGSGTVTVTVRAFTDDLRSAVLRAERATDESALTHYIQTKLTLSRRDGHGAVLTLVGTRRESDVTVLTLTTALAGGLRGVLIHQAMQMELFADQVNVVQARYAGRNASLLFLPGEAPKSLP